MCSSRGGCELALLSGRVLVPVCENSGVPAPAFEQQCSFRSLQKRFCSRGWPLLTIPSVTHRWVKHQHFMEKALSLYTMCAVSSPRSGL